MRHSAGDLAIGDFLDNRFRILELINQSRWSSVFKALDVSTRQIVVVKVPPRHLGKALHVREAEIGRQLDHPAILKFIPVDERAKSRSYLVTEFLEGSSLHEELHRRRSLPIDEVLNVGVQVCEGLDYLHHRGIVHGDLKPGNIMLCHDGSLRIIDFGSARCFANGRPTSHEFPARVGTPEYMAPEQVKGRRVDARTDLYALGAVLYEAITGEKPFDTEREDYRLHARLVGDPVAPSRYQPELSRQVEEIILHALARRPEDRYDSAASMRAALAAPDRVSVTGRAARLETPVMARLLWPVAGFVALSLLVPVVLFFVFLTLLTK